MMILQVRSQPQRGVARMMVSMAMTMMTQMCFRTVQQVRVQSTVQVRVQSSWQTTVSMTTFRISLVSLFNPKPTTYPHYISTLTLFTYNFSSTKAKEATITSYTQKIPALNGSHGRS